MANVRFVKGPLSIYKPDTDHKNCVFFCITDNSIYLNGVKYSGGSSISDSSGITRVESIPGGVRIIYSDSNSKDIPLDLIETSDKIISLSEDGLIKTDLSIKYDPDNGVLQLLGRNNEVIGDPVDISELVRESFLESAILVDQKPVSYYVPSDPEVQEGVVEVGDVKTYKSGKWIKFIWACSTIEGVKESVSYTDVSSLTDYYVVEEEDPTLAIDSLPSIDGSVTRRIRISDSYKEKINSGLEGASTYNTDLGDVVTQSSIGGIPAGTAASSLSGKSIDDVITMILFPETNPTIVAPGASAKFLSTYTNGGLYEVGSVLPGLDNIGYTFSRGSIKVGGQQDKYRSGEVNTVSYLVSGKTSDFTKTTFEEGTYTYKARINYLEGQEALTSYGNHATKDISGTTITNPLPAGTLDSSSISIYGVYPIYASSSTQGTLTKQSLTRSKSGVTLTLKSGEELCFAIKGTCSSILEYNSVSGKYDIQKISGYTGTSVTMNDASGTEVTYTKYTRNDASGDDIKLQITFA